MPYSTCMRCKNCDGFPCVVHAKSDAEVIGVRPALEHANVDAADQRRGDHGSNTNAAGHHGDRGRRPSIDGQTEETLTADIVVVSCGAANSASCC